MRPKSCFNGMVRIRELFLDRGSVPRPESAGKTLPRRFVTIFVTLTLFVTRLTQSVTSRVTIFVTSQVSSK